MKAVCHATNVVRFIACNSCNTALGLIGEDPAIALRLYEVALECQRIALGGLKGTRNA